MPGSPLVEADNVIVLRDKDLEDVDEITRFTQWLHTLKLNDVSSWQLDMRTQDFNSYDIDENSGVKFYRDGVLLIDGPISSQGIKQTLSAGAETTTIIGGCDNAYLSARICYPVVTGPIFDVVAQKWKFGVLRSCVGISTSVTKGCPAGEEYDVPIVVADAEGFMEGNTVQLVGPDGTVYSNWNQLNSSYASASIALSGVDFSTNTLTLAVPQQYPAILTPDIATTGGMVYQTSGGIVDDPAYTGYDIRTGPADKVAKELVFFNAGIGACSDQFGTRAIPYLAVAAPTAVGGVITSSARGENLLTQVQDVCASGSVNFQTTQVGNELVFDTFIGNNLAQNNDLIFSVESGNLKDYTLASGHPTANMIWGCGPDTGPDKTMLPSGDIASIGSFGRWESWISAATSKATDSSAIINASMVQTNNLALTQSIINTSMTLTIQETDQVRYPRDFQLGDKVIIVVGSRQVTEIITAIQYSVPTSTSGGGSGTALSAALAKQPTQAMKTQKVTTKQIQQMLMA